jgi:hypothetical protein
MPVGLKTVAFAFPTLASLPNNTLTNLSQITVELPETGTKTIRKAWVEISMDDITTATGNSISTKTVNLRLGAAGYTSTTNSNTIGQTGENIAWFTTREFTSHFTTNWTGTSMTCDVQLQVNNSGGTTFGFVNATCILYITYEYDDASTTQLKTVWFPLDAPAGALPTTKTSHDTIPVLDTELPEAMKSYKSIAIVTQANRNHVNNTDYTVSYELNSAGVQVTGNYEAALLSDVWSRYVWLVKRGGSQSFDFSMSTFQNIGPAPISGTLVPFASPGPTYTHAGATTDMTFSLSINFEYLTNPNTSVEFRVTKNGTTDISTISVSSAGVYTTGGIVNMVAGDTLNVRIFTTSAEIRILQASTMFTGSAGVLDTSVTNTFNVWSSLAARHHSMQAWMIITYTFDAPATTSVMNSLMLPMEIPSPMGGTAAADFQRATREFWVQESNPTRQRLAAYVFWQATSNETGLNARIGTGSFVAYTNVGSGLVCGNKGLMIRNDSPTGVSFARGRNTLQLDIYNTSATQRAGNVGGFWILNYTSDKHSDGVRVHNKTILWPIYNEDTGTAVQGKMLTAGAINIPETNYFVTSLGIQLQAMIGATSQGITIKIERLASGEGGLIFEPGYADIGQHDAEMGNYNIFAQIRSLFRRWNGDTDTSRLDIETARRYYVYSGNAVAHWTNLTLMLTYHTITYTVNGTVSGSAGGTVDIEVNRVANGERVLAGSRTGNGAFSFTWYDNTEQVCVGAYESSTLNKISAKQLAGNTFDVNLAASGGSSQYGYGFS